MIIAIGVLMVVLSIFLLLGFRRRVASLFLCGGFIFFNLPLLILNPPLLLLPTLLLLIVIIPSGEALSLDGKRLDPHHWTLSPKLFYGFMGIVALVYSLDGIYQMKLLAGAITPGSILSMPVLQSHFILLIQIIALPLCVFFKGRIIFTFLILGVYIVEAMRPTGMVFSFGMIILHLLLVDPRWFMSDKPKVNPILFFDGICGLCLWSVDLMIALDSRNVFRFAPLQGVTAKKFEPPGLMAGGLSTMVYANGDVVLIKSSAVLRAVADLGGQNLLIAKLFLFVPISIRDRIYDLVAKHRYEWFGKKDTCRIPSSDERLRFLP